MLSGVFDSPFGTGSIPPMVLGLIAASLSLNDSAMTNGD